MIPVYLLASLMISLVVKNIDGWCPLTLTIEDTLLLPPVDAIAKHFGASSDIKMHCADLDKYLCKTKDGKHFVCPNTSTIEKCYPPGRNITLECTAEWDSCTIPCVDFASEGAASHAHSEGTIPTYDNPTMQAYSQLLRCGIYPVDCSDKKDYRKRVNKHYFINTAGDMIQKRQTHRPYKQVLSRVYSYSRVVVPNADYMKALVLPAHLIGHPCVNKMEGFWSQRYKYDGLRQLLVDIVRDCDGCGDFVSKPEPTNKAIISSRILERVLFDYFQMPFKTKKGYEFVLLLKDHFTKYTWGKAYKKQRAAHVVKFMMSIFRHLAMPEIMHADNGSPFIAEVLHLLFIELGNPEYVHGAPYHPQSQGLIENGVGDIKDKLKRMARDEGTTVPGPGSDHDWVPNLDRILSMVNDMPIKMYNNKVTPFMALNSGAPRNMPEARKPSGVELNEVHADMFKRQVDNARKRGLGIQEPELDVGTVVRVRATKTEMKKKMQLGEWTARGIVHGRSSKNDQYYIVRWLTPGVGTKHKSHPNELSQPLYRGSLRPISIANANVIATVYNDGDNGDIVEVHNLPDGTCTYMFLAGTEAGNVYSSSRAGLLCLPSCPYPTWLANEEDKRKAADVAREADDLKTPLKRKTSQTTTKDDKCKKPKYNNPSPTTTPKEYIAAPRWAFKGSDDPPGLWLPGTPAKEALATAERTTLYRQQDVEVSLDGTKLA